MKIINNSCKALTILKYELIRRKQGDDFAWQDKTGKAIPIKELNVSHLYNIIRSLQDKPYYNDIDMLGEFCAKHSKLNKTERTEMPARGYKKLNSLTSFERRDLTEEGTEVIKDTIMTEPWCMLDYTPNLFEKLTNSKYDTVFGVAVLQDENNMSKYIFAYPLNEHPLKYIKEYTKELIRDIDPYEVLLMEKENNATLINITLQRLKVKLWNNRLRRVSLGGNFIETIDIYNVRNPFRVCDCLKYYKEIQYGKPKCATLETLLFEKYMRERDEAVWINEEGEAIPVRTLTDEALDKLIRKEQKNNIKE